MRTSPGTGRLLDKVAYVSRPASRETDIVGEPITVYDTFPYNPDSKTAPGTAMAWASGTGYGARKEHKPDVVLRDNDPFDITIVDLDYRGRGGRAYKVVDSEMRRFDLREDQLIEIFRLTGVLPKGAVPGKFVWGLSGSQMHLVLVGGECHQAMVEGAQSKKAFEARQASGEAPTPSTLVPGRVYRKKDGSLHVFLGRCKTADLDKTQCAFVALPTPPERTDVSSLPEHADHKYFEARNVVADKWDAWSWRSRCRWSWIDCYRGYGSSKDYDGAEDVVLMATPKFDADAGEVEADLWQEFKANAKGRHGYKRAGMKMHDLAYEWAVRDRPRPPNGHYWAVGDIDVPKARTEFSSLIEWL